MTSEITLREACDEINRLKRALQAGQSELIDAIDTVMRLRNELFGKDRATETAARAWQVAAEARESELKSRALSAEADAAREKQRADKSACANRKLREVLEQIARWDFDIRGDCVADAQSLARAALAAPAPQNLQGENK